jgi:hypothetical protein
MYQNLDSRMKRNRDIIENFVGSFPTESFSWTIINYKVLYCEFYKITALVKKLQRRAIGF